MSEHLALDVEVVEPPAPAQVEITTGRHPFTALQFAAVAILTPDEARSYLGEWEQAGIVARTVGGWTLTPWGQRVALGLAQCTGGAGEE